MKYIIPLIILITLCISFVSAQTGNFNLPSNPNQNPNPEQNIDPRQASDFLQQTGLGDITNQLESTIQPLIKLAEYILGGLFGLYVLLVLIRIHYERKKVNLLKDIRFDLDNLSKHFGVSHSALRKGFFARLWAKMRGK